MKKLLSLMLMLLMISAVGCILGGDDKGDSGDTGISAKAAEYLPLKVGATWKWKSTDEEGYTSGSTETITGTTTLGGKEYYIISEDDVNNTYVRVANNIVYIYMEEEWVAKVLAQGATFEAKDVPMFDFNKSAGKTWSIYSDSQNVQGSTYTVTMTGKYVGLQSVTVPAGSFTNCAVFEITMNSQYTTTWDSETYSGSYTYVATHYFAKGIGPIKMVTKGTDISGGEKYESTETQEATYYTIPGGATGGDPNSGG